MYIRFKRLFDFLASFMALVFLSPLFLITTVVLAITNQGKPFFFQKRPGKDGRIFCIIKFRSMNDKKDKSGNLLPFDQRLTRVGRLIRMLSIDEIPQLLNVFMGDMSFIGPRPLLVKYLPLYNEFQARRHEVRPGISGWAQVNGRNAISWDEKFSYDIFYVDNISFKLDLLILWLTIKKVLLREGINQDENLNMVEFGGNN